MHNPSTYTDAVAAFRAAAEAELGPMPVIEADGALHRFRTQRDKRGQRSGWYVLFFDRVPAGAFGDWKTGVTRSWSAVNRDAISPAERTALEQRISEQREAARRQREAEHKAAAEKARKLWGWAKAADPQHPYLQSKQVQPHGLRQHGATLLVPLVESGELVNLQRIHPNGEKRFLPGGRVRGLYSPIGLCGGPLYVCEGWATGATIHAVTGRPVACAMNAGNLAPVAQTLRRRYPGRLIIIAGDNDRHTKGNPGKTAAMRAAKAIGGEWIIPNFPADSPGTDFNDLARLEREGAL
jgi:putative DNA primase/helicase